MNKKLLPVGPKTALGRTKRKKKTRKAVAQLLALHANKFFNKTRQDFGISASQELVLKRVVL